jgi:hypothetical protein
MCIYQIFIHGLSSYTIFSTLSHKWYDFWRGKNIIEHKYVSLFSLQILFETFFILRRSEWDMTENVYWSSVKYLLFLSDFNEFEFSGQVFKKYSNVQFH